MHALTQKNAVTRAFNKTSFSQALMGQLRDEMNDSLAGLANDLDALVDDLNGLADDLKSLNDVVMGASNYTM